MKKCIKRLQNQRFRVLIWFALIYLCLISILMILHRIFPTREGYYALSMVVAPYLFVPFLFFLPFLFWKRTEILRILFLLATLLFVVLFSPRLAFPATTISQQTEIEVLSWNTFGFGRTLQKEMFSQLFKAKTPDVVAFQEVGQWELIAEDPMIRERYPYQLVRPEDGAQTVILLSRYAILEHGSGIYNYDGANSNWYSVLWARLDPGGGRNIIVIVAHTSVADPFNGCGFCTAKRDAQIKALNGMVHEFLQQGDAVIVVGDMNITDREVGYQDLARGLHDAHLLKGNGSGHSWGNRSLNPYWALMRIDYILISSHFTSLTFHTDCTPYGSDHCIVTGTFSLKLE